MSCFLCVVCSEYNLTYGTLIHPEKITSKLELNVLQRWGVVGSLSHLTPVDAGVTYIGSPLLWHLIEEVITENGVFSVLMLLLRRICPIKEDTLLTVILILSYGLVAGIVRETSRACSDQNGK
ncbi:hypothetical protein RHSIM_RhsimUnG0144000 [Rhododendron simsii]|uniref:Uncharacterized protein n=1 Tax=Rhododendron simsii TaxID=118357 RepID=A0A834FUC8_RHOSS|nr:hypothetical protein RHSIM_RhsimUnG0144000 [Rhododendron simsii]